jgi:spoIIIJ-associated protein
MGGHEFDGKDLDDALRAAAETLGRPAAELDYEILEGGRKGVFGLGARPIRIRVAEFERVDAPLKPPPTRVTAPRPAPPPAPPRANTALSPAGSALREIFEKMGFDLRIEETRRDGALELTVDGADLARVTAKDGELLSAVEFILNRMGRRSWPDEPPVHVVGRGFRSERDDELVLLVRQAAAQVTKSGVPRRLPAMNPYERRVVHMTVREHPGLTTVSEGDGFMKRVRVEKLAP